MCLKSFVTIFIDVSCGGHSATDCASCGPKESFCHGDCVWQDDKCVKKQEADTSGNTFYLSLSLHWKSES